MCERFNGSIRYYIYDENGSIAGMRYRTSSYAEGVFDEYFFEKNLQGDVVAVYNASGTKLISYKYDAWGNFTTTYHNGGNNTTAKYNPFRYRGYYYDSDIGLYYLNTRYYSPELGRFISADALIDHRSLIGNNLYAYCWNNPIIMIDVYGTAPQYNQYISEQTPDTEINGQKMKDIKLGFSNIFSGGCGVIAAYNVLLSRSYKITFDKVKNQLTRGGKLNLGGLLGVNPFGLADYMRSKFWFVFTEGFNTNLWGVKAELSQSIIILLKWEDTLEMHYIAGIGTGERQVGGSFVFYNTGLYDKNNKSIDGRAMSVWKFLEYAKQSGATPLYFIGVSGKKGWW